MNLQVDERTAEFYSMLLFKSLTAGHSGIYTCVVSNTAGKANMSAELAIKGRRECYDCMYCQLQGKNNNIVKNFQFLLFGK